MKSEMQARGKRTAPGSGKSRGQARMRVVVCADLAHEIARIIPAANAIATALDAPLAFIHVLEASHGGKNGAPIDPVEWDIRRREAAAQLSRLVETHAGNAEAVEVHLLEGRGADQICGALTHRPQDIAVLGKGPHEAETVLGETARRLLEKGDNSVLLVPQEAAPQAGFSKIIVPLDCSGRSERVLPLVQKLAKSGNAEIVLIHAVPASVFTGTGPGEASDEDLKARINQRNQRVARRYLDRLCGRLRSGGIRVSGAVLEDGDARRRLLRGIDEAAADLLVLASHGHSGFADVPFGDVASFLIARARIPTLVMRFGREPSEQHAFSDTQTRGTRRLGTLSP